MNNSCKQIEVEYQNPTIMDLMAEIDRLTQELSEVKAENYMLRNDNILLHNSIEQKYEESSQEEGDLSMLEEYEDKYLTDVDAYLEAFDNISLTRL